MKLISRFFPVIEDEPIVTSSPHLDVIEQAWEHIGDRYLARIKHNRTFSGRVRSILSLASYDALNSVTTPGNGHIYKEISKGSSTEAAAAAAIQASHDILAAVFNSDKDREDLADYLAESLALFGNEEEKRAGIESGRGSAESYLQTFSTLLTYRPAAERSLIRKPARQLVAA